jgi:pyruvate dehydrogenase E1 component beta subunit
VIAAVVERAFGALLAPPRRLGNPNVPVPFAPSLEDEVLPGRGRIASAVRDLLSDR